MQSSGIRKDKILVIQGAAGSGKTSVALHRIAYLLYHDRETSEIFQYSDLVSKRCVFGLYFPYSAGTGRGEIIREMSFDLFAYRELHGYGCVTAKTAIIELERQLKQFPDACGREAVMSGNSPLRRSSE